MQACGGCMAAYRGSSKDVCNDVNTPVASS